MTKAYLAALFPFVSAAAADCVAVGAARIMGADLARADATLAFVPPGEFVAYAPLPGAVRTLAAQDIAKLAARYGKSAGSFASLCFVYETRLLAADEIGPPIRRLLAAEHLEVVDHTRFPVPAGEVEWGAAAVRGADGTLLVRGVVRYGERRTVPLWARVKAKWRERRVLARSAIDPGTVIRASDVEVQEVLVDWRGGGWCADPAAAVGRVCRRRIEAGQALASAWLDRPREVERGQIVVVEARFGGARLALRSRAESSGRQGERIVLVNEESGRRFAARITGPGKAEAVAVDRVTIDRVEVERVDRANVAMEKRTR